jgi:hypothetical protein
MVDRIVYRVDPDRIDAEFLEIFDIARAVIRVGDWILLSSVSAYIYVLVLASSGDR